MARGRQWRRLIDAIIALFPEHWEKWCALSLRLRVEIPDLQGVLTEEETQRHLLEHIHLVLRLTDISGAAREMKGLYDVMVGELFAAGAAGKLSGSYYDHRQRRRQPITLEHWTGRPIVKPVPYFGLGAGPGVAGLDQGRLWVPRNTLHERVEIPIAERIDLEADELRPWPGLVLLDVQIILKAAKPDAAAAGKRGRPSEVERRVENEMRSAYSSPEALEPETGVRLAVQYKCSASTALRVKNRILNRKS